jgi:hypothetical protein
LRDVDDADLEVFCEQQGEDGGRGFPPAIGTGF